MKNGDYWKQRFTQLEAAQNNIGAKALEEIDKQYKAAQKQIEADIDKWYARIAKNNNIRLEDARKFLSNSQLKEFQWDVNEYIKRGRENAIDQRWMKELENASAKFHISRLEALKINVQNSFETLYASQNKTVSNALKNVYTSGYYHTAFELQRGFNVGFDIGQLDQSEIEKVLSKPWAADKYNFSERIWKNKNKLIDEVHKELTQNIMLGEDPQKAIDSLAKKMNTSKHNAARLVMTEEAYFSSAAQKDCFNDLDVEQYEIVAILDSVTSDICRNLDGKVFDMKDFQAGVTAPPFHVWCRSTTVPYFKENFGQIGERAAKDKDGKTYYVPDNMNYEQWKETFVDGGDKLGLKKLPENDLTNSAESGKISLDFTPALNIQEAEEYARNILGVPNVSYKGVDVTTANEWNRGLADSFNRFPELKKNFGFVGECHERNVQLKPVVVKFYTDDLVKSNPNLSLQQLKPYIDRQVNKAMRKMSVPKNTMAQSWSPKIPEFQGFKGITVNRDFGKNSSNFLNCLKRSVENKFHPEHCDTIRSVLDHEIGHQLDRLLDIRSNPEIKKLFDEKTHDEITAALSKYSWDNSNTNKYSEMIAEGWAEYCNSSEPREMAKTIGKIIEEQYKNKFGNP